MIFLNKFSRRILCLLLIILCSATFLSGCIKQISGTELILGTIVNIQLYGKGSQENLEEALNAAMNRARTLEHIFSVNNEGSELNYVNQNASKEPVSVSEDLYKVLERSLHYANLTKGAFDPTLGKLISLWGIGTDHAIVPTDEDLLPFIGKSNYKHVILDPATHTVYFENDTFFLDLGAIAKGYIADEIKTLLQQNYNITNAIINLGGNVITIGGNPNGDPWKIGIANPDAPEDSAAPAVIAHVNGKTLVTSGDYQRFFEDETGMKYHHILDGQTGYPANTGLKSVSIITEASMDADALSTAVFVLGYDNGLALIESLDGIEAVFINENNQVTCTSGLDSTITSGVLPLN